MTASSEKRIARYWLGSLSAGEQEQLEEQYFLNDNKYEEVLAGEDELIDRYVRNDLSAEDRDRFEKHYLKIPGRTHKVELARKLLLLSADPKRRQPPGFRGKWGRWDRLPRTMILGGGIAAGFLGLALVTWWLSSARTRLAAEVDRLRTQQAALQTAQDQLATELGQAREPRSPERGSLDLESRPAMARPDLVPHPKSPTIAFLLKPGLLRSGGSENRLVIPRGVEQVRLQIEPEGEVEGAYAVVLRTAEGIEKWRKDSIALTQIAGNKRVIVSLPARIVADEDYVLTLLSGNSKGEHGSAGEYFFHAVRQ